ncbi:MAG: winged helix-turn-helix transcriptional regulator [Methanospirillum sp.]|nr:winged helix-turn-helix transcriptional regulator [Methanospirillum sp.]
MDGIIERTIYPDIPPRVDYRLTEMGRSVFPVLGSLHDWEPDMRNSDTDLVITSALKGFPPEKKHFTSDGYSAA